MSFFLTMCLISVIRSSSLPLDVLIACSINWRTCMRGRIRISKALLIRGHLTDAFICLPDLVIHSLPFPFISRKRLLAFSLSPRKPARCFLKLSIPCFVLSSVTEIRALYVSIVFSSPLRYIPEMPIFIERLAGEVIERRGREPSRGVRGHALPENVFKSEVS